VRWEESFSTRTADCRRPEISCSPTARLRTSAGTIASSRAPCTTTYARPTTAPRLSWHATRPVLEIGGFDKRYEPGYYEDTDYCFEVRKCSRRVYYQPESVVVHTEGGTGGTDLTSGAKRYQVVNQAKFARKWKDALRDQPKRPVNLDLGRFVIGLSELASKLVSHAGSRALSAPPKHVYRPTFGSPAEAGYIRLASSDRALRRQIDQLAEAQLS